MSNSEKASLYALARTMGYEKSLDDFIIEYSGYYDETIKELNSKPVELAKVEAVQNPWRSRNPFSMN